MCYDRIERGEDEIVGVKQVKVDLKSKLVEVEYDQSFTNELLIVECIEDQGFDVQL